MTGVQFDVNADDGFYVIVTDGEVSVYEAYSSAVDDIQAKLTADAEGFLAEVAIDTNSDDVAVTLEQVSWQQVIRDMSTTSSSA